MPATACRIAAESRPLHLCKPPPFSLDAHQDLKVLHFLLALTLTGSEGKSHLQNTIFIGTKSKINEGTKIAEGYEPEMVAGVDEVYVGW